MLSLIPAGARHHLSLLLASLLLAAGCAASSALQRGKEAERQQDYDRAGAEYTKTLRLRPNDIEVRLSLDRAKLRASNDHLQRGRRFSATGKYDQALLEYQLAAELNPTNGQIEEELRDTRAQLRNRI